LKIVTINADVDNSGNDNPCPRCGSVNARRISDDRAGTFSAECLDCGLKAIMYECEVIFEAE
jgi:predicted RNA-binding Zn-ribbon protein involved in translation (DUF1610 family)